MILVATCMFGLEKKLGEEIDALGLKRVHTMDGRVTFEGSPADIARANMFLRCAERVMIKVGEFPATTYDMLFEGVKSLPWEEYIGSSDAFPVKGHCIKSKLFSIPDCQSIIKKAVVDRLSSAYGIRWFTEDGAKYQIEFFLFKDVVALMLDTSGIALHKRGYRPAAGVAPLRETLAAQIAYTARPMEDILFWDPFCGSGTIAIEAAMIATRRAPGLGRSFAGQSFACIPERAWTDAAAEAQDLIIRNSKFEAWASDIDEDMLDVTYENATRAGVEEYLNIFRADARKIKREDRKGTVVCNPPYGERMMDETEVAALYRDMGKTFADLYPWHVYIITSYPEFERKFGRVADKTHRLYNGMLPCTLYEYFRDPAEAKKPAAELRRPFDKAERKPRFDHKKPFDKGGKRPDFKKK